MTAKPLCHSSLTFHSSHLPFPLFFDLFFAHLQVHAEGLSDVYDTWVEKDSADLAEKNTHTKGPIIPVNTRSWGSGYGYSSGYSSYSWSESPHSHCCLSSCLVLHLFSFLYSLPDCLLLSRDCSIYCSLPQSVSSCLFISLRCMPSNSTLSSPLTHTSLPLSPLSPQTLTKRVPLSSAVWLVCAIWATHAS